MKKRNICRWLALCMTLVLMLTSLPLSVVSGNIVEIGTSNDLKEIPSAETEDPALDELVFDANTTPNDTESDVYIVQEDVSKRGAFEKHYLCSDGTYVAATYAEAVHYLDDAGQWQEVDCRLTTDALDRYVVSGGDCTIALPTATTSTKAMALAYNGTTFTWTLQADKSLPKTVQAEDMVALTSISPTQSAAAETLTMNVDMSPQVKGSFKTDTERLSDNTRKYIDDEDAFALPNTSNQIRYEGIFGADEGISVVYTTYYNKVEEDIYIEKPTDIRSFSIVVDAPGTFPQLNEDNSVDFLNEKGELCYRIGIPYMVDADHAVLTDIHTAVSVKGNGYVVTYTPNEEWLTSAEREYPIMLDPSISTGQYVSNIQDTYVEENVLGSHPSSQWLYVDPNNGNRRLAIFRVTQMPSIPASMPIVGGRLWLYMQYGNLSEQFLKLAYTPTTHEYITAFTFHEADVRMQSASVDMSFMAPMLVYATSVSFLFGQQMQTIYNTKKILGAQWHHDFVLGFYNSDNTSFVYPFHSAESTTINCRPALTITYGYALPSCLSVGETYSFVNVATGRYMTVGEIDPADGVNVYQYGSSENQATDRQRFRLEFDWENKGYVLRSMAGITDAGKLLDIEADGWTILSGDNVQVHSADDPTEQSWLFFPEGEGCFRIVPHNNPYFSLTTFLHGEGSSSGTTAISQGNIFVMENSDIYDPYQLWYIYDEDGYLVQAEGNAFTPGKYQISNGESGRYLHTSGVNVGCARDKKADLEQTSWVFTSLGGGDFLVTVPNSEYYLAENCTVDKDGDVTYHHTLTRKILPDMITDNFIWRMSPYGAGYVIRNKGSGLYLTENTVNGTLSMASNGSTTQPRPSQIWRFKSVSGYKELTSFSFGNIVLGPSETKALTLSITPTNADWATVSDFIYTLSTSEYISLSGVSGSVTRKKAGTTTITAIHKTTGLTAMFTVSPSGPFYGCKPMYEIEAGSYEGYNVNCQGYAFWTFDIPDFGTESEIIELYGVATSNEALYGTGDITGLKNILEGAKESGGFLETYFECRWEEVFSDNGGEDILLADNQWLVAFRVGKHGYNMDYHFWYRTDTGEWTNKHGFRGGSGHQPLGSDLPSDDNSLGWSLSPNEPDGFYDSDTIYYVLTEEDS